MAGFLTPKYSAWYLSLLNVILLNWAIFLVSGSWSCHLIISCLLRLYVISKFDECVIKGLSWLVQKDWATDSTRDFPTDGRLSIESLCFIQLFMSLPIYIITQPHVYVHEGVMKTLPMFWKKLRHTICLSTHTQLFFVVVSVNPCHGNHVLLFEFTNHLLNYLF